MIAHISCQCCTNRTNLPRMAPRGDEMTVMHAGESSAVGGTDALDEIAQRVLWLSTAIIPHANRVRPNPSGMKVGGHQASCASMVTIMTSLYFEQLRSNDRVSVKPHASPVLHSINYLL